MFTLIVLSFVIYVIYCCINNSDDGADKNGKHNNQRNVKRETPSYDVEYYEKLEQEWKELNDLK